MRNGGLRKVFPLFLFLILTSLFLFLIDNFGWIAGPRGFVQRPFLALERPLYRISQSTNQLINQFINLGKRDKQIVELQTQLRQLAIDQNQLSTCLEENEHLKKLLGAPLPSGWKFKMARVVGVSEKMRIDLGARDGVEEGMTVVVENIYLGQVVSSGERDSLVQLPTDLNSKIPVVVKKPGGTGIQARGLLIGQPGGKLLLDQVLQEEDIRQGDLVVTSGETGYLPDLVIGRIDEVLQETAEVYKQAIVKPLVDYQDLRLVFLVIP